MKCFVSVLGLLGVAAAAPQYIADTPEVQQAKVAFAEAFNKAANGAAIALEQAGVQDVDPTDPDFSPAALPYVHVDIPAEPYVHVEPAYVYTEGEDEPAAAPIQQAAPVVQKPAAFATPVNPFSFQVQGAPVQATAPAPFNFANFNQYAGVFAPQQLAFAPQQRVAGGCYNWKGEGVQCAQ